MKLEWKRVGGDRTSACKLEIFEPQAGNDKTVIACYRHQVPFFAGKALDTLYASLFSSLIQFAVNGAIHTASTYVARRGGKIVAILLFRFENRRVYVINEVMRVDAEEIRQFVKYIFLTFRSANVIFFRSIETNLRTLSLPFQRFNCLEDIVVNLPETTARYHACLGKSMRRNIKRHLGRLRRDFPSFRFQVLTGQQIDENQLRQIIDLNKARMTVKKQVSKLIEPQAQKIIDRVKACGMVGIVTINGRICAGAISYRILDNYFLGVLAHDPIYDHYRLGGMCCYLMICDCIERHGKEFHFLWGRYDYKYLFFGVQHDLDNLTVYRSRLQWILNSHIVLKNVFKRYVRFARLWLQSVEHRNNLMVRLMVNSVRRLQNSVH